LLQQRQLVLFEDLCDHVRQGFPDIPEHELFPHVIGALDGAQLTAANHFIAEHGRASFTTGVAHLAVNARADLAIWNTGLVRYTQSSAAASPVGGPSHVTEPPPRASSVSE